MKIYIGRTHINKYMISEVKIFYLSGMFWVTMILVLLWLMANPRKSIIAIFHGTAIVLC